MRLLGTEILLLLAARAATATKSSLFDLVEQARSSQDRRGAVTHEQCSKAVDRLHLHNVDPNKIIKDTTKHPWTDETFMFPDSVFWEDMPSTSRYGNGEKDR